MVTESRGSLCTELLISEVAKRPALWDTSFEEYKSKHVKNNAWMEVCCAVIENFELQSEAEKKVSVSNVKTKWRAMRDNYIRYLRKETQLRKSGSKENLTQYIHHEHLSFLQKTAGNCDGSKSEDFPLVLGEGTPRSVHKEAACKKCRTSTKRTPSTVAMDNQLVTITETEKRPIIVTASPVEEDDDLLFFKSLLPTVRSLRQDQKMAFRINVMRLLQEFSSIEETIMNS